jgi:hypothetical protein
MDIRLTLPAALRHRVESEEYLWARLASLLLSPPVVWAVWVFAIAWTSNADRHLNLRFATLFAFAVCAAPIFFVTFMVRNGRISDLHMRESRERYIPYSIAIIGGLVCAIIFWQYGADPMLYLLTLVTIVELAIMLVGTLFIHISFHAAGMASVISATALIFGFSKGLVFLPLLLLVVLARLVLERHTPAQIILGALIGVLTPLGAIAALGMLI